MAWRVFATLLLYRAGEPAQSFSLPPDAPAGSRLSEMTSRDDLRHATVRAVRLTCPLRLDGVLDEPIYRRVFGVRFVRSDPEPGSPATQGTDVWLLFDEDNGYNGKPRERPGQRHRVVEVARL